MEATTEPPSSNGSFNSQNRALNWGMVYTSEIFTVVFLSILGLLTTLFNGFTLFAIYKDPMRCFRTPLTTFITGIIFFDFLTGIIVEPAIACIYAIGYIHHGISRQSYRSMVRLAQIFALTTMNSSFLIFLALAIAQLLALRWPRVYERYITNNNARIAISLIWCYSALFALLPELVHISLRVFYAVDLVLHTTIVTILLIIVYAVTYYVFKSKISPMLANAEQEPRRQPQQGAQAGGGTPLKVEREFLKGTFLLTLVLLVTVFPFTIALYIWIFKPYKDFAEYIQRYVAVIACENVLFLKFLWDPAILILRIPTYRKSVVMVCSGLVGSNAGGVVAYNRHADEEARAEDLKETTIVEEDIQERSEVQT